MEGGLLPARGLAHRDRGHRRSRVHFYWGLISRDLVLLSFALLGKERSADSWRQFKKQKTDHG